MPLFFMTTAEKIAAAKKRIAELKLLIKLWEVCWQRKGEDMFSLMVQLPPKGWLDPDLVDVLPKDVIKALIKKYNFNEK